MTLSVTRRTVGKVKPTMIVRRLCQNGGLFAAAWLNLLSTVSLAGPVLNVHDFGALGDGVSDDGPAFQQALDEAALEGMASVTIPTGTYLIDRTLIIGNGARVRGAGDATVLIRGQHASAVPVCKEYKGKQNDGNNTVPSRALFRNRHYKCPKGDGAIVLSDFVIDGINIQDRAILVDFSSVNSLSIENVKLRHVAGQGIAINNYGNSVEMSESESGKRRVKDEDEDGIGILLHSPKSDTLGERTLNLNLDLQGRTVMVKQAATKGSSGVVVRQQGHRQRAKVQQVGNSGNSVTIIQNQTGSYPK